MIACHILQLKPTLFGRCDDKSSPVSMVWKKVMTTKVRLCCFLCIVAGIDYNIPTGTTLFMIFC